MHEYDAFLFSLFAIFVAAKAIGEIFERLRLPAVLGEISAGVMMGPFALGWIQSSDPLRAIAEMGAIFVLFNAGLEVSPKELIKVGRTAMMVAIAGVIFPLPWGSATCIC